MQRSIPTRQHQIAGNVPNQTPTQAIKPESKRGRHPPGTKDTTCQHQQNGQRRIHNNIPSGRRRSNSPQARHSYHRHDRTTHSSRVQIKRSKIMDYISRQSTNKGTSKQYMTYRQSAKQSNIYMRHRDSQPKRRGLKPSKQETSSHGQS